MACPGEGILTNLAKSLEDKTVKEFRYFLDFENHVQDFVIENNSLAVKRKKVENDVEDAKKRNENQIEGDVQNWIEEVDIVIQENTKIKQTWSYGWCPYWQYRQGKMLAKRTPAIRDLIHKCNFERVARLTELPGIKYHASCDFIHFESRTTKVNQLVEALKDGKQHMIGLQGMGGTGKTTLVTQVGKQLEESKAFERAIFIVVSNPPDVNKIRGEIARPLGLNLENWVEAEHSQQLWTRISKYEQKLLIILDDVWEELNLKNIGIPFGPDHKNCYVLITTRDLKVCDTMRCQQKVVLEILDDKDALNLFLSHARSSEYSSSNNLESFARDFVKECGGLPIAIVALASTLRNCDVGELNAALITLQKSKPFFNFDKNLEKVYKCLELSYLNLPKDEARKLFLLCSIFPEDYEIPINLIVRLGIGLGILEKVDEYCEARRQAHALKTILINSSLLLNVKEDDCVKMHDVVREVAQWIGKEYIQVIMNSRTTLKPNMQFVFWSAGDFPDQFDGTKLEVLLLWISGNVSVKNPNAFLMGMTELKILFLRGEYVRKLPSPSLLNSLLSLTYIQTLILEGWELGDISILENISSLVTLEFKNCLIIELPRNITKLEKLRWLGLRKCEIQRNNPFEVTKRCSQLEELYFVGNYNVKDWNTEDDKEIEDEIAHDISPAELQIFSIAYDGFERFSNDDNGLLRCFNPEHIKHLIPDALFKYLVRSAEVLELGKIGQTRWKNLAPDIIPMENGGMDNLIKLYLYEWDDFECLVDNSKYPYSTTISFSKMVELHLDGVGVKRLYQGAMPSSFLLRLQILKLEKCMKLQNIFFDENIKLPYLKVLTLIGCLMFQPSIFQRSVAQSLERLEELVVEDCEELKCLIAYEEMIDVGSQENYCLLFQKLKSLQIRRCGKLEMVFSLLLPGDFPKLKDLYIYYCRELKYIFGEYRDVGQVLQQEIILPLLTQVRLVGVPSFISIIQNCHKCVPRPPQVLKEDSMVKQESSKTSAFSWAHGCCFLAPTKDTNIGVPHATMKHHTISQGSSKGMETVNTAECLTRHPLSLQNIRHMTLSDCSKLKSLFSVSIATTMILLETLCVERCEELKDIIRNEAEDDDYLNCTSIFLKLQSLYVYHCNKLEFIFPSTLSGGLQKLKDIYINKADELKYVFGKYNEEECVSSENENDAPHIHLPALEALSLFNVPNMISIGIKRYQQKWQSLQIVEAPKEIKKHMQDVTSERAKIELQEIVNIETPLTPSVGFQYFLNFHNLKEIQIWTNQKLKTLFSISACKNLPQLSVLRIGGCEELVNVVVDDSNDHHHMNYSSIFPKLEDLSIRNCNKLEFIFPLCFSGSLQKLKSLIIGEVAELKYIFGNESDELHIHLPATLKRLSFIGVPKIMNKLLAKKYHVSFLSLQSIELGGLQEFNGRSFLDLMAYLQKMQLDKKVPKDLMKIIKDVQKLTRLGVGDSKIEEVLNLEGVEIEGTVLTLSLETMWLKDLCELRHICKGPKYILSLHNLCQLDIVACKKLRIIFCVSIVKSLPQLFYLSIKDCDKLVNIIEESNEDHLHQICFPKLYSIIIKGCNSLKCLFSISTCGVFPELFSLEIEASYELGQVFIHKQDDTQKMTIMKEVFPKLSNVILKKLPMLITICEGIDFQTRAHVFKVDDCPKYQGTNHIQEGLEDGDPKNNKAIKTSVEEVASSFSKKETVKEIEPKDPTPALLEKQALEGSTTKPQLRSTSLHNYKETEKEGGRVVPDPTSKTPAPTSSSFQILEETLTEIQANDPTRASGKQTLETSAPKSHLRVTSLPKLEDEHKTCESIMQLQQEGLVETKIAKASHKTNIPFHDNSIDAILKERAEEDSTSGDVVVAPRNSWDLMPSKSRSETSIAHSQELTADMIISVTSSIVSQVEGTQSGSSTLVASMKETHDQGSQEDDATEEAPIAIQSTDLESKKQTRSSRKTEKEAGRIQASQLSMDPTWTNSEITQNIIDTMEQGLEENYVEEDAVASIGSTNSDSRKQSTGLIDNLSRKDSAPSAKETAKTIHEKASPTYKSPMAAPFMRENTAKETGDHPSVQEEAESEKPIKAIPPQVIPSLHHQSKIANIGSTSSPKLGVCEIFQCVELKDGETALLAQALERYPQLLLPQEHRSQRMIAWSYRVLVDILVVLATKTPYSITSSEKSTLVANLSDATLLGFDKEWVDSVLSRVFGGDMSDVLAAEEEIQVKEAELETCDIALKQVQMQRVEAKERLAVTRRQLEMAETEFEAIDSQLSGLLEDRNKLIAEITVFREIICAKGRPFGI